MRDLPLLPQLAAVLRRHKHGSRFSAGSDYVFATGRGTPFLHHNVSKRMLRRAALGAGLNRGGRRVRFHDLRVSGMLGHARPSMTLDTYTHLFEQATHGADVRAQLARSDFAMLFSKTLQPSLLSRERPRSTRATERPRAVRIVARKHDQCCPRRVRSDAAAT